MIGSNSLGLPGLALFATLVFEIVEWRKNDGVPAQ